MEYECYSAGSGKFCIAAQLKWVMMAEGLILSINDCCKQQNIKPVDCFNDGITWENICCRGGLIITV